MMHNMCVTSINQMYEQLEQQKNPRVRLFWFCCSSKSLIITRLASSVERMNRWNSKIQIKPLREKRVLSLSRLLVFELFDFFVSVL